MSKYRYSEWDGRQDLFDLDADGIMDKLGHDLMSSGDVATCLHQMQRDGIEDGERRRLPGTQALLDQLHRKLDDILKVEQPQSWLNGAGLEAVEGNDGLSPEGQQELERLKDIAHHLVKAESHHQREEEILFPKLGKHDIVEPPEIMKLDHVEFRKRKQALYQLAHNHRDYDFPEFKNRVIELGEYLTKELENHIFKEDNILYQIALQVLSPEEWEEVKKECDKIGYCCFTPEDQSKEAKESG
jgi:DUF438 domain-containing protein